MASKSTRRSTGNLVSGNIPNLIGGVSQQPWNVRMATQAEEQINCHSTITEFLRRRPATRLVAPIESPDGSTNFTAYAIDKGTNERYVALFGKGGIKVYDLEGNPQIVIMTDSGRKYLGSLNEATVDLRFCTIQDYTFCVNRQVIVNEGTTEVTTRDIEAVVFVKQASYQTTYELTLDGTKVSYTTSDGVYEEGTTPPELSANLICRELNSLIDASKYSVTINDSVMWIKRLDNAYFTFSVDDTRSGTHIVAFRDEIRKIADLPVIAPKDILVRIVGDPATALDDYYVKFVPTDGTSTFAEGSWVETVAPATNNAIDPATMPHALIRRKAGEFTFEPVEWAERTVGDADSNPTPSFVGSQISNILYYRNRLAVLSGENIIMSEAHSFFNFYLTTVTTAVDSDPIDVAASGVKDAKLYGSAVYNGGLILFSTKGQFLLEHDTVLANSTVSLTPITTYESTDRVTPQPSGKTIFFAVDRGKWVGIREYIAFDSDSMESNDATDISAQAPRYILGQVRDIQCSSNEDVLLVSSVSAPDTIYVYKYFWNGNEKVQTSWYKWVMNGNVYSHLFFNTDVYCVMEYDGQFFLEVMSLEPSHKDVDEEFEFCLDRKIDETSLVIGTYDTTTKLTPVSLSYKDMNAILVTRSGGTLKAGRVLNIESFDGQTFMVKGEIPRYTKLFAGVPFRSLYTFTTMGIRDSNNTIITSGRLQLRNLRLAVSNTGYLDVLVQPRGKVASTYTFTGKRVGDTTSTLGEIPLYEGMLNISLLARNEDVKVEAVSSSHLPFSLVNGWWEGLYSTRNQRV